MKKILFIIIIFLILNSSNIKAAKINSTALIRSALLPGWGQIYYGYTTKGWIYAGSYSFLLFTSIYTYVKQENLYKEYTSAHSDFDTKWDNYISQLTICQVSITITATLYIVNLIDAAFLPAKKVNIVFNSLQIYPDISNLKIDGSGFYITYTKSF